MPSDIQIYPGVIDESTIGTISPSSGIIVSFFNWMQPYSDITMIVCFVAKIYSASIKYLEVDISKPLNNELAFKTHPVTHIAVDNSTDQLLESDIKDKISLQLFGEFFSN